MAKASNDALDKLIKTLAGQVSRPLDAIDAELARETRSSAVRSLRDAPEVEAFRTEMIDGMIRVDTVNKLLAFVNTVVSRMLAG